VNIYFCGLIGSGKTTIGKRVAADFRLEFLDIDQEIDRRVGYSFHKLVEEQGWVPYRETEYSICKDLARRSGVVVSMAGGTVRYEWNTDVLRGTGPVIFLEASLGELANRVRSADRPRVNRGTTLEEDLRIMWEKHGHKYLGAADFVYKTEGKSIDEEVADIERLIMTEEKFSWMRTGKNLRNES